MDVRLGAAVAAGKLAAFLSRLLQAGGGTTIPGEVALRVEPRALAKLARRLANGSIVVTGTNGKTTTSRLISNVLVETGWHPVHNRAGANMVNGMVSALVDDSPLLGQPPGDVGLFEVDEAFMPEATSRLLPRTLVVTNLFRDQLDRYGEIDYLAGVWRKAIAGMPAGSTVVLNADDPLVASLGEGAVPKILYFGVDDIRLGRTELDHAADSKVCLRCRHPFEYEVAYYGHVGLYRCPNCGAGRPVPAVSARRVDLQGDEGSTLFVTTPEGEFELKLRLPGVYNIYNALAATTAALSLGIPLPQIARGIERFTAAFGRLERIQVSDRTAFLALVKNPVGFNQVIRTIVAPPGDRNSEAEPTKVILIVINDNFADGTDISWLWDVDFELLQGKVGSVIVSGLRAEDMLVRLKYAEVDQTKVTLVKDINSAFALGLERVPVGGTLYVFPTYTAMLDLRAHLARQGYVEPFWEN